MNPLPADKALDACFLEVRSKILDIAAALDRIGRGSEADRLAHDPRLEKIRQALALVQGPGEHRAERVQQIFSLAYDAGWEKPQPR